MKNKSKKKIKNTQKKIRTIKNSLINNKKKSLKRS